MKNGSGCQQKLYTREKENNLCDDPGLKSMTREGERERDRERGRERERDRARRGREIEIERDREKDIEIEIERERFHRFRKRQLRIFLKRCHEAYQSRTTKKG